MATVSDTLTLDDRMSGTLGRIATLLESINSKMDKVKTSSEDLGDAMGKTTVPIEKSKNSFSVWGMAAGQVVGNIITKVSQLAMQIPAFTDQLISMESRLSMVGVSTDAVYKSAMRARGSYTAMGDAVAKLGLLAGDSFKNQQEILTFTELMQKSFKVGGAGAQEQASAMYQLTQAMAAGKLQGDEFRSITENAPMLADAIAKYTGVSKGALKEMSSEGMITADIIKNSLFSMSDELNSKFEDMPMTFGESMNRLKNVGTKAFGNILTGINRVLVDGVNSVTDFIESNLDKIKMGIAVLSVVVSAFAIGWAISWAAANMPIIIAVGAIVLLSSVLSDMGIQADQVLGFIGGMVGALFAMVFNNIAYMYNGFVTFAEFLINVWTEPEYSFKMLINNMLDTVFGFVIGATKGFDKAATALANAFIKGANWAIGGINKLIDAINLIPGVNIGNIGELGEFTSVTTELENLRDAMKFDVSDKPENYKSLTRMEYKDIAGTAEQGVMIGMKLGGGLSDVMTKGFANMGDQIGNTNALLDGKGSLKSAGDVEIDDENLKWLLDISTMRQVKSYNTAPISITVSTGDIHKEADEDRLVKKLTDEYISALNSSLT